MTCKVNQLCKLDPECQKPAHYRGRQQAGVRCFFLFFFSDYAFLLYIFPQDFWQQAVVMITLSVGDWCQCFVPDGLKHKH